MNEKQCEGKCPECGSSNITLIRKEVDFSSFECKACSQEFRELHNHTYHKTVWVRNNKIKELGF